jgi:hypothetical protein
MTKTIMDKIRGRQRVKKKTLFKTLLIHTILGMQKNIKKYLKVIRRRGVRED